MAGVVAKINGVDKVQVDAVNYLYNFPTAIIRVYTVTAEITTQLLSVGITAVTVKFADLSNNFGTANALAYVDYLATNGYYFGANSVAGIIPANAIWIDNINQLPTPVGGVINFGTDGNFYIFTKVIDCGGLEVNLGNNSFMGSSQELAGLENCTITVDDTCTVKYFRFNNVQITIDSPTGAYDWNTVNIYDSADCITVVNADNIVFEIFGFINSYGFKVTGTVNSIILAPNCIFRSATEPTAIYFELASTAVINRRIRIQDTVFASENALQTGIKVDALSTIGIESFIMKTVRFTGPGTFLDGINGGSDMASFFEVTGGNAVNSTAIANMYMKNNAVVTPIAVINDRYEMEGVTEFGPIAQRFVHDVATNSIEYISSVPRIFRIQAGYTVFSSVNNVIGVYIGINTNGGIFDPDVDRISESEMYTTTGGSRPESGLAQCLATLNQGDRIYMILQNKTATQDVTIEFLNVIVEKAAV